MLTKLWLSLSLSLTAILAFNYPVLAETKLEIDYETTAFTNRELKSGKIQVLVNYQPFNLEEAEEQNLRYRIFYDGIEQVNEKTETYNYGQVYLQDLDQDKTSEVIIQNYTGGAHCCTSFTIYSWQKDKFVTEQTPYLDGYGGTFKDINNDGKFEFLTVDNSFLYQFSSYAGSFPPSLIFRFNQGKFTEATRRYPQELKAHAWRMYQALIENQKQEFTEVNGILAGYVAQKILLGEYQEGWDFMLAHYDHDSEWGLEIYQGDNVIGKHADFPNALRAFLIEQGYLDRNGKPKS